MKETAALPFTLQLLSLAKVNLDLTEQQVLTQLIDQLVKGIDNGHSCLIIHDLLINNQLFTVKEILSLLAKSGLTGNYTIGNNLPLQPLTILHLTKQAKLKQQYILYLTRYLYYEVKVAQLIQNLKCHSQVDAKLITQNFKQLLLKVKDGFPNFEQLHAIKVCSEQKLSLITGGPGTGKTTTILLLLWLLSKFYPQQNLNLQICAPTGKATARAKQAIAKNMDLLQDKLKVNVSEIVQKVKFATLHKLLGYKRHSIYFEHNQANPLNIDILIIDESSMISLPLFYKLLLAINPNQIKHIILLGDKNQLSSVEEGYVFATLINSFKLQSADLLASEVVTQLLTSNRSINTINTLANHVLNGDTHWVINYLNKGEKNLMLYEPKLSQILTNLFNPQNKLGLYDYINCLKEVNLSEKAIGDLLFKKFNQLAILCLNNKGSLGVDNLNLQVDAKIKQILMTNEIWYTGRPIMILTNDYNLNLYNGDIGICLMKGDNPIIVFEDGREFIPEVLPHNQLAYAITIHKAQGSEFEHVNIVLTKDNFIETYQSLLSRELLYTAITRAKLSITLYAGIQVLEYMVSQQVKRNTGLGHLLSNLN